MNTDKNQTGPTGQADQTAMPANTRPCENCGAVVPRPGICEGRLICCAACVFHPLGCRCKFGEFGKEETRQEFLMEEDGLEDCCD